MFTGLVQDIGQVTEITLAGDSLRLGIQTALEFCHLQVGASVACNGCCLTVVASHPNQFWVEVGPKTVELTRFGTLKAGDRINLEPALRVGDPLGGHQVTGHIDGVFSASCFEPLEEGFWRLVLEFPISYAKFLVRKGSLCVAGISLTIADVVKKEDLVFAEFMIIPHTYKNTILHIISSKCPHFEVEFDQMVKTIACLFEDMIVSYPQLKMEFAKR